MTVGALPQRGSRRRAALERRPQSPSSTRELRCTPSALCRERGGFSLLQCAAQHIENARHAELPDVDSLLWTVGADIVLGDLDLDDAGNTSPPWLDQTVEPEIA